MSVVTMDQKKLSLGIQVVKLPKRKQSFHTAV